jgi:LysM repeat protein
MNNPNPLVPQGSNTDQKIKGRNRFKIAFFFVLAIHGIGLMALLISGCRKEEMAPPPAADTAGTNVDTMVFDPTNPPVADTNIVQVPAMSDTNVVRPSIPEPVTPILPSEQTPTTQQYKVAKGDTFGTIAAKFKVTTAAIQKANPGVEPTKLQINQVLNIPAPTAGTNPAAPSRGDVATPQIYKVKSGDTLTKIATRFNTSVKALRALNGLKTDTISVGQSLKIPVKTAPTPNPVAPSLPAPASGTAPTGTSTVPPGQ